MPELPEVETIVRSLRPALVGQRIAAVRHLRPDILSPPDFDLVKSLVHRKILAISRRGKKIVFDLGAAGRFYIHLGMSGRLTIQISGTQPKPHTHLILMIGGRELHFVDPRRFGGVFWLGIDQFADTGLGPEPLEMRAAQLARALAGTHRAIKTALMDQKLVAGLGNIYVDESLFSAGIHPQIPANEIPRHQITRLNRSIKRVLRRALRHRGSTLRDYRDANGQAGEFQKIHRVYDRAGESCVICGTSIVRIVLGGRSTHFCPKCQGR
jgi:formamidopyrimidine-DNA glycosylase